MSKFSDRICAAANFEVQSERTDFWSRIDIAKQESIEAGPTQSSRYVIAIVQACAASLSKCGQIIWKYAEADLRSNVFFLLSVNDVDILSDLCIILREQRDFFMEEFKKNGLKTAQHYQMENYLKPMDMQLENLLIHCQVNIGQLYEAARGEI